MLVVVLILYLLNWSIGAIVQHRFVKKLIRAKIIKDENSVSRSLKILKIVFRGEDKAAEVISVKERAWLAGCFIVQLVLMLWIVYLLVEGRGERGGL